MLSASRAANSKAARISNPKAHFFITTELSMDSLHAIGFYVSSGVSLAGGLGVALLSRRDQRGAAMAVSGLGLAGIYLSLSAGFAAAVALLCYAGCAALVAGPQYRSLASVTGPLWRQLGALGAAAMLVVRS